MSFQTLDDIEAAARDILPPDVHDYYAGGADDEQTLRWNREGFSRWAFRPRALVDVSRIDTSLTLLGTALPGPVLMAPTAFQKLANPDGERAAARAARAAGTIFVASTLATCTIEDIAAEAGDRLWLQLYVFRDREITRALVARAEAAGCRAICLTVTVPVQGNRLRDARNRFGLPAHLEMANFAGIRQGRFPSGGSGSSLMAFIHREFDPTLTWEAVAWLRSITQLPIVIKGILTGPDAARAVDHGASALIVSNHGGRQLDGCEATIRALPSVVEMAGGRVPVLLDGGIRRGSDAVKALCLGARAVLIGRPYLWGLATGGQDGVAQVLAMLQSEIERTMALLGRPRLSDLDPSALTPS